jgi:hypothetical protein
MLMFHHAFGQSQVGHAPLAMAVMFCRQCREQHECGGSVQGVSCREQRRRAETAGLDMRRAQPQQHSTQDQVASDAIANSRNGKNDDNGRQNERGMNEGTAQGCTRSPARKRIASHPTGS